MYKKGGKKAMKKESWMEKSKEVHFGNKPSKKGYGGMKYKAGGLYSDAEKAENIARVKELNAGKAPGHQTQVEKKTGGKSMEPGGGGRFAALVGKLKGKGKSEESAKAIAASIGRAKYGKSKFQAMAAAGKKGLGGASDSTGANEAGMEMLEGMRKKRSERVGARAEKVMGKAKANWQKAEAIKNFDKSIESQNMAGDRFGQTGADKANRLYARAERQENRAKRLKERSEFLKASGKRMGGKKC